MIWGGKNPYFWKHPPRPGWEKCFEKQTRAFGGVVRKANNASCHCCALARPKVVDTPETLDTCADTISAILMSEMCCGRTNNQYHHGPKTELSSKHSLEHFSSSKKWPSPFLSPKALSCFKPFPCLNPALLLWHAMTIRLLPPIPWRRQVWLNSTVDENHGSHGSG